MNTSKPITTLKNIGAISAAWLSNIGILTLEGLQEKGIIEAYQAIKKQEVGVSLNLLYALYGAIHNKNIIDITDGEKAYLAELLDQPS